MSEEELEKYLKLVNHFISDDGNLEEIKTYIANVLYDVDKNYKQEIERLKRLLSIEKEYREKFDKDNQRLYKIINETSEILKFHLSNPSQTINGWHIDIWNSKDIEKLNKMLNIIEIKEENNG